MVLEPGEARSGGFHTPVIVPKLRRMSVRVQVVQKGALNLNAGP